MREPISLKLRFDVLKRDRFTCQYCGARPPKIEIRVDHIDPVARGGSNGIENLITACFECNAGKRDDEVTEFALCRRVWARARTFRNPAGHAEFLLERWTLELVYMFVRAGNADSLVELTERHYDTWNDWSCAAELWYRDYLAHCVDLHLGTNGYELLRDHATPPQVLS